MFLRAKRECNSGAPKRNGRLCLGGQEGVRKENANWFCGQARNNQRLARVESRKENDPRARVAEKGKFIHVKNRLLPPFVAGARELA